MRPQTETISSSLFNKLQFFELITRTMRWIVIIYVSATVWFVADVDRIMIANLIFAAIIYNLLRMSPLIRQWWLAFRATIVVIDTLFAVALIIVTGGLTSPYLSILSLMAISVTYWYGALGLAVAVLMQVSIFSVLLVITPHTTMPGVFAAGITMTIVMLIGYYVMRLTDGERRERLDLESFNAELSMERERIEALINSLSDAVMAVDREGTIKIVNASTDALLQVETSLIGRKFDSAWKLYDLSKKAVPLFAEEGGPSELVQRRDLTCQTKNGTLNLDVRVAPYYVKKERRVDARGSIVIIRDITKEKSLEDQRQEFISVTSHELKTPLAVAEANLSTAMLPAFGPIGAKAKPLLNQVYNNIRHLSEIVADLTTLRSAEQGLLDVELSMVNPHEVLQQLANDQQVAARQKGLEIITQVDPGVRPVLTSRFRVVEVLQNFTTNALKYTQKGSITLMAEPTSENGVKFSVKDTGIGITTTDQQRLFGKFYRSEDYRTRQTGGTGLGLYITQRLADRLNGKISFTSQLNHGSTFCLVVPQYSRLQQDSKKVVDAEVKDFIGKL